MPDLDLSVTVSRDKLGLAPLEIARGGRYYLATQFLGGSVQWTRQQVTSPFVDGQITTQRTRQNVTESVAVEVKADNHHDLQIYTGELLAAFLQSSYTMVITMAGAVYTYRCEAADYQVQSWSTPRAVAVQGQAVFTVQRRPVALAGGV